VSPTFKVRCIQSIGEKGTQFEEGGRCQERTVAEERSLLRVVVKEVGGLRKGGGDWEERKTLRLRMEKMSRLSHKT